MILILLVFTVEWAAAINPRPVVAAQPRSGSVREAPVPLISAMFPSSVRHWSSEIVRWASENDLPPDLVAVVMTLESCGDPSATSAAGAQGLFQVMPFHFAPDEDPYDPEVNARRGLAYLRDGLHLAAGDASLALAGYNGGHALIDRNPAAWPSETVRYVRWGTGILSELREGMDRSPTLEAWLDAGGASLCRGAAALLP